MNPQADEKAVQVNPTVGAETAYSLWMSHSRTITNGWILTDSEPSNSRGSLSEPPLPVPLVCIQQGTRDLDENKVRTHLETFKISSKSPERLISQSNAVTSGFEAVKPVVYSVSKSGRSKVSIRQVEKKTIVEVFSGDRAARFDASSLHGEVVGDAWFGGSSWSNDERFVVYVAKVKDQATTTLFGTGRDSTGNPAAQPSRSKYEYIDDWGEKYEGTSSLCLCILELESLSVRLVAGIDSEITTVGQPVFAHGYTVVYTAWDAHPRRLGMLYCYQRLCKLYSVDISSLFSEEETEGPNSSSLLAHHQLTPHMHLARSARYCSDIDTLVFLGRHHHMPTHNGCSELLCIREFSTTALQAADIKVDVLVGVVDNSEAVVDPHFAVKIEGQIERGDNDVDLEHLQAPLERPVVDSSSARINFPGIFTDQLPRNCFWHSSSGWTVLLNSQWGGRDAILEIFLEGRLLGGLRILSNELIRSRPTQLRHKDVHDSWNMADDVSYSLLDSRHDGWFLFQYSAPNQPPRIGLSHCLENTWFGPEAVPLPVCVASPKVKFSDCMSSTAIKDSLAWKVFTLLGTDDDAVTVPFEYTLLVPCADVGAAGSVEPLPLVVVPHGGPHSCMTTTFVGSYAFLATHLKVAVMHVNYRGSTGFGQRSIDSLPGRIGKQDVQDVMACVHHALSLALGDVYLPSVFQSHPANAENKLLDARRLAVVGGSHGGFLGTHLIGQYPTTFRAACVRNPVTNIPAMTAVSDISDWCWVEGGASFNFFAGKQSSSGAADAQLNIADPTVLKKLWECSPIRYVNQVTTPLLLCIGLKDRRVPPSQGIEYYHALRTVTAAKGLPLDNVKMMTYPEDCHAIDRPTTEAEQWVAISSWLATHLLPIRPDSRS